MVVWPLGDQSGLDRTPAVYWPEPELELDAGLGGGPVLVTVTYTVARENVSRFVEAMEKVRRMKMRTGATSFALYPRRRTGRCVSGGGAVPELGRAPRQHGGRLTGSDRDLETAARECADGHPQVQHLLPPGADAPG